MCAQRASVREVHCIGAHLAPALAQGGAFVFDTSMDRVAEDGTMTFPTIKAVRRALG